MAGSLKRFQLVKSCEIAYPAVVVSRVSAFVTGRNLTLNTDVKIAPPEGGHSKFNCEKTFDSLPSLCFYRAMHARNGQIVSLSQRISAGLSARVQISSLGLILVSVLVLLIISRGAGTG